MICKDEFFFRVGMEMISLSGWLMVVSALGAYGCVQALFTQQLRTRQFTLKQAQVTPLTHHSFAAWTAASTITRFACALDTHNPSLYRATMATFVVAAAFYIHQVFVHRAVPFRYGLPAFLVAGSSLLAMASQYSFYTRPLSW